MSKPTKMQTAVLAAASERPDAAITLSPTLKGAAARAFVAALVDRGYASKTKGSGAMSMEGASGDDGSLHRLVITDIGRQAIGHEPVSATGMVTAAGLAGPTVLAPPTAGPADDGIVAPLGATDASKVTKQSRILDLLARPNGASLDELTAATGWLPHTVRAALVRLRQKGRSIAREQGQDKVSRYRLTPTSATVAVPSAA